MKVLEIQVELVSGNAMQDIEEMAILCHELLTSNINIPESSLKAPVMALAFAVLSKYPKSAEQAQVIECLREANMRLPHLHYLSFTLATFLSHRFDVANSIDDYEEGMAILDKSMTSTSQLSQEDTRIPALETIKAFAFRAAKNGKPEYLEEASRLRTYLSMVSFEDSRRHAVSKVLGRIAEWWFHDFGVRRSRCAF
jgi:hypothetical protein